MVALSMDMRKLGNRWKQLKKHGFTISICTCVLKHVGNRKQSLSSAVPACLLIVVVGLPLLSVVTQQMQMGMGQMAPVPSGPSVPCPSASAAASWPVVALPSAASPAGFQQHFEFGLAKNLKRQLK